MDVYVFCVAGAAGHISLATIEDQEALTITKHAVTEGIRKYFTDFLFQCCFVVTS